MAELNSSTKQCKDCHLKGDFSAPLIKEHNPYGEDIKTTASCIDCHANSHVSYSDSTTTPSSIVAMYGKKPEIDTTDCLNCHSNKNETFVKLWGSAIQVTPDNMFGATTKEDCYNCHTTDKSPPKDLHSESLTKEVDFKDCKSCHSKINLACYACHGDPNKVDIQKIMNKDNSKPYKDCHITGLRRAPKIKEHNPYGEDIKTTASCIDCHANSHVSYSDLSVAYTITRIY